MFLVFFELCVNRESLKVGYFIWLGEWIIQPIPASIFHFFLPWYLCRTPKGNTEGILLPVTKEDILWCSEGQTFISKTFVYSRQLGIIDWKMMWGATYTKKHVVESIMTFKELKKKFQIKSHVGSSLKNACYEILHIL